jgi:hypothetical protein
LIRRPDFQVRFMHSKHPPRNRLAKIVPERWRLWLLDQGVPKRKYTAVCRASLASGRVIESLIIEHGWIVATDRAGLAGEVEQRIDFDPREIQEMELVQFV